MSARFGVISKGFTSKGIASKGFISKGFTLVELVLVLVISAGLLIMMAPVFDYSLKQPERINQTRTVALKAAYVSDFLSKNIRQARYAELASESCMILDDERICFDGGRLIRLREAKTEVLISGLEGGFDQEQVAAHIAYRFAYVLDDQAFENLVLRGRHDD